MKKFTLLAILITFSLQIFSQDQIKQISGQNINCKILKVDTLKIEFMFNNRGHDVITRLDKNKIESYKYKGEIIHIKKADVKPSELIFSESIEKYKNNFLYTYQNKVIEADYIELKNPFLGSDYFSVDSEKMDPDNIKFYKNETGFYANTSKVHGMGISLFSRRIRKGKINLYEYEAIYNTPGVSNPTTGMPNMGTSSKTIRNYYNIGFGDLKKANYKNLVVDLSDNPYSMDHLNKMKKQNNIQLGLNIGGGLLVATGLYSLINKETNATETDVEPNINGNITTIIIGAGCIYAGYFISLQKPEHLRKAIEKYNL